MGKHYGLVSVCLECSGGVVKKIKPYKIAVVPVTKRKKLSIMASTMRLDGVGITDTIRTWRTVVMEILL